MKVSLIQEFDLDADDTTTFQDLKQMAECRRHVSADAITISTGGKVHPDNAIAWQQVIENNPLYFRVDSKPNLFEEIIVVVKEMDFFDRTSGFWISAKATDKILSLKFIIKDCKGIPVENQILYFGNEELHPKEKTLGEFCISGNITICLYDTRRHVALLPNKMRILVECNNSTIGLDILKDSLVSALRDQLTLLQEKRQLPFILPMQYRLKYGTTILDEKLSFAVQEVSTKNVMMITIKKVVKKLKRPRLS